MSVVSPHPSAALEPWQWVLPRCWVGGRIHRSRIAMLEALIQHIRRTTESGSRRTPALSESGLPGFSVTPRSAIYAPAGTPRATVDH